MVKKNYIDFCLNVLEDRVCARHPPMLSNNVGALKTSLKFNYYANTSVLKTTKYATNVKYIYHVDSCYPLVRSQLHF